MGKTSVGMLNSIFKNAEGVLGLTAQQIMSFSPNELKEHIEKKSGKKIEYKSEYPTIGRGNVLRDIVTTSGLNREVDKIIG